MTRWQPNTRERLQRAALELFQERGYAGTTVEEIAARGGVTERTFFRYFADKREVLFAGGAELQQAFASAIARAPEGASPLEAIMAALESAAPFFQQSKEDVRLRQRVIASHAELQERELIKLNTLGEAVTDALQARGVSAPIAGIATSLGIMVFKAGFERWLSASGPDDLTFHMRASLRDVDAVLAGVRLAQDAPGG